MNDSLPQSPNPYAATTLESERRDEPLSSQLPPIEPLKFRGTFTKKDYRRAILGSNLRKDIQRVRRILFTMATLLGLLSVLTLLPRNGSVNVAAFLLWGALAWFLYWMMRLVSRGIVMFQFDRLGVYEGQIDHKHFDLRMPCQDSSIPIDAVVACSWNRNRSVVTFDAGLDQLYVFEFDHFEDPVAAGAFFQNLSRMKPPVARQILDSRRTESPTLPPRFRIPDSGNSVAPIFFDGPVHFHDIAAMTFRGQYWRKLIQGTLTLAGIWVVLVWLCSQFENRTAQVTLPAMLGVYFLFVIGRLVFQVRSVERSKTPLFWSKGWITDGEYVGMTNIGQSRNRWESFERVQIGDNAIQLKAKSIPKWYFLTRNQFESDESWMAACELIHAKLNS